MKTSIAAIRFGYGLGPDAPSAPEIALAQLTAPDGMDDAHPVPRMDLALDQMNALIRARKGAKKGDAAAEESAKEHERALKRLGRQARTAIILRALDTPHPLRERMIHFWADHFAIRIGNGNLTSTLGDYVYGAIGRNVGGRFADMLKVVARHPLMLSYLDQVSSVGPNSPVGQKRGVGLNENYARELLELHTLGVDAAYTQRDVRQMAELLAGMRFSPAKGFFYDPRLSEPGPETVLGRSYGAAGPGKLAEVDAALEDLAIAPDTARHMARKLAVHFVGAPADPDLVAHLAGIWMRSGGDLLAVTAGLLDHPAAVAPPVGKVKPPFDYIISALRGLGVGSDRLLAIKNGLSRVVERPMSGMGQVPFRAVSPAGLPEDPAAWITPQGLATRIRWAMAQPGQVLDALPDPRDFVGRVLGPIADDRLVWAVSAAETRAQGVGLVLASPAFIRR
nr:DUF1800 domain-containing protein [Palleronia pontilimi]